MSRWIVGVVVAAFASVAVAEPLDYVAYELQSEQARPAVCLNFDRPVPRATAGLDAFVEVTPRSDVALVARGRALCLEGLVHGRDYAVKLRAGLPAQEGEALAGDVQVELRVPDRQARLVFAGKGSLLPLRAGVGLPLKSVNLPEARLRVYKIGERNLLPQLDLDAFGENLNQWAEDRVRDQTGRNVFQGRVELKVERNQETTTSIPIESILPRLEPGLFVAVAEPAESDAEPWEAKATQWFTVSDIALQTFAGTGGTTVLARSLATAEPLAGVSLRLLARNNEPLHEVQTDAAGRALIEPARLRGKGGQQAKLLLASRPTGELTFLELDRPALDLVDLGVDGRTPPGPMDAFLWTERGIYRPGETVHLAAMLRDRTARSIPDMPLTLKLLRPDLVEARKLLVPGGALAAGKLTIEVPSNAYSGLWSVTAHVGDDTPAVGRTEFLVQDFVPPRLEVAVAALDARPPATGPIPVGIDARYLYGAPAGELTGEAELSVQAAEPAFPGREGWSFGLVQEPFLPQATAPVSFTTDDKGKAAVELALETLQETTHPLRATIRARVMDIDGRPTGNAVDVPLATAERFVGIRPAFDGSVAEGEAARFEIALVDGTGAPAAPIPLSWALLAEDWDYVWFERYGRWQYESVVRDRRVASGELTPGADGTATLEVAAVDSGRYRLEVFDPASITATSHRFTSGWWSPGEASLRPEKLDVTAERAGNVVRATIRASFPARVTVALADDAVRELVEVALPKGGGTVELPASAIGAGGAYVLATAVSPTGAVLPRLPVRAVGAAWIAGPLAERRLDLAIEAPSTMEPERPLPVTVRLANAVAGEKVWLTLAMVDDAILQMTSFEAPDPARHYLGRRALGIELRDVYGRLIDPAGQPGKVVSGGDQRLALQAAGIDVKTYKTVATMSEVLEVGADGAVRTSFPVPDFSGRLRLVAVAWSAERVGNAQATLTVRPGMLVELTRPRFLAPGDRADIRLRLTALGVPDGTYEVALATEGPLTLDRQALTFKDMQRDKGRFANLKLTAASEPGTGKILATVKGEQGVVATQTIDLAVRTPQPWLTRRQLLSLAPGRNLDLGTALAADLLPGTASAELTLSTVPAFDVPGLLADLDRYPYGCAEQTVSRALPHLYVSRLAGARSVESAEAAQRAIGRLASLEGSAGGFSPWSPGNDQEYWLTAYVADFLGQAKAANVPVPTGLEDRTLRWLAKRFGGPQETVADTAAAAYAGLVLAKAGRLDASRLRYFALRNLDGLPSDAARVQLAGALLHLGERDLGERVAGALGRGRVDDWKKPLLDYGTRLRDEAVVLATATENGVRPTTDLLTRAERAATAAAEARYLSTQESAWLVRAAAAFAGRGTAGIDARLAGETIGGKGPVTRPVKLDAGTPPSLENRAAETLYLALGVTGIPKEAGPPEARGFEIKRRYLTTKGQPANLARLRQSEQVVVLIEGKATLPGFRRTLVVDLLPAGLELEALELKGSSELEQFAWLGELTGTEHVALRDDRFVAALDLEGEGPEFRVAYLARAVTAGSYVVPGVQVEDMVEPGFHARGPTTQLTVVPR